ncbi:MAG: hypothetical protein V1779_09460 [bacterium]
MFKKIVFIITLILLFVGVASAQSVTGLRAVFKKGQTFLTWDKLDNKDIQYYIYRSTSPFIRESDINKNTFVAKIDSNSSQNKRLSDLLQKPVYFRIDDLGNPLDDTKCLYVQTATIDGAFYYAVMPFMGDKIIPSINQGNNTTKNPVYEIIEPVSAVFQMTIDTFGYKQDIYTHWVGKFENHLYPAMTSTYCYAYNFSVISKSPKKNIPLFVCLHGREGNFLTNDKGTRNPDELILSPDDFLPNDIHHSYWYGYLQNFNFFNPTEIPKTGIVMDYTVRRTNWTIDWVCKQFPVDTNRIYLTGGSMGGGGSVLLSLSFPEKIAAVYSVVPKLDYSFINDPNAGSYYNYNKPRRKVISRLWGDLETNLMTNDSILVYNRLNTGFLASLKEHINLPVIYIFAGKNDNIVGWAEKIDVIKRLNDSRQAFYFFWDSRSHSSGSVMEFKTEENIEKIYKYALNKSYPAFSNCSANGIIGDGNPGSGDIYGTINGFMNWDDNITDDEDYYEIMINSQPLNTIHGTIKNPDSIFTDITFRRLQKFVVNRKYSYYYQNIETGGNVLRDGYIEVDNSGLLTLRRMLITSKGNKLVIIRFDKE